jgi:hypothetical protein
MRFLSSFYFLLCLMGAGFSLNSFGAAAADERPAQQRVIRFPSAREAQEVVKQLQSSKSSETGWGEWRGTGEFRSAETFGEVSYRISHVWELDVLARKEVCIIVTPQSLRLQAFFETPHVEIINRKGEVTESKPLNQKVLTLTKPLSYPENRGPEDSNFWYRGAESFTQVPPSSVQLTQFFSMDFHKRPSIGTTKYTYPCPLGDVYVTLWGGAPTEEEIDQLKAKTHQHDEAGKK